MNRVNTSGTLMRGMQADLFVRDRNLVVRRPAELGETSVLATYVDCIAVFRAGGG